MEKQNWKKNLFEGVVCEMAVKRIFDEDGDLMRELLMGERDKWSWTCEDAKIDEAWDLNLVVDNTQAFFSVEVKSARNGGAYSNFFAETRLVASNTRPEFLASVPTFIFYVDLLNGSQHVYDGPTFVKAVKAHEEKAFVNRFGTAEGILFPIDSKEFGHMCSYTPDFKFTDVVLHYRQNIQDKMNLENKKGSQHKVVAGMKTLS